MPYQYDHAMCAVVTLEAGTITYEHLGFTTHEGGKHTVGTQNSVVPLRTGYLELLSIYDEQAAHNSPRHKLIAEYIEREAGGLIGFALRTTTIEQDVARVAAAGLSYEGPVEAKRVTPDGRVLEWKVLRLTPQPCPAVLPMLVSGDQSAPPFNGNRNKVVEATGMSLVTPDPAGLADTYRILLAMEPSGQRAREDLNATAVVFDIDGFAIEILEPSGPGGVQRALDRYGGGPVELRMRAEDPSVAGKLLGLVPAEGVVTVPPAMALGVRMVITG